jgi:hypothetical protein
MFDGQHDVFESINHVGMLSQDMIPSHQREFNDAIIRASNQDLHG